VAGLHTEEYRRGIEKYPTIGGTTTTTISGMVVLGTTSMFRQERRVVLMVGMAARGSKVSSLSNLSSTTDPSFRSITSLRCVTNPSSSMEALLRGTIDTSSFMYPKHLM